uniref:Uncharacterized protein n=1 Tax=Arundo donax TaxID=35708 RepID=A0A0A9BIF9_ARUDO
MFHQNIFLVTDNTLLSIFSSK